MIAPTFILDQTLVNLADPFSCQRDSSFVERDPTLLLHLLDKRLVWRVDTVIASKVIPVNVVGTWKVKSAHEDVCACFKPRTYGS